MSIKNIDSIETMLNIEAGTLQKAIENEDQIDITIPELVIRTKDEEALFTANTATETKARYEAGLETGEKRSVNASLEKYGITLDDQAKTFENFADAFKQKIESEIKQPKDSRITELETDLEKVRTNLSTTQSEFDTYKTGIEEGEKTRRIDSEVLAAIPDQGTRIPKADLHTIFNARYTSTITEDNKTVWSNGNGEVLKDNATASPLTAKQIVDQMFIDQYLETPKGGAGKGDEPIGGSMKYDDFVKEMAGQGHSEQSLEFQQEANKRLADKSLVM